MEMLASSIIQSTWTCGLPAWPGWTSIALPPPSISGVEVGAAAAWGSGSGAGSAAGSWALFPTHAMAKAHAKSSENGGFFWIIGKLLDALPESF